MLAQEKIDGIDLGIHLIDIRFKDIATTKGGVDAVHYI